MQRWVERKLSTYRSYEFDLKDFSFFGGLGAVVAQILHESRSRGEKQPQDCIKGLFPEF